MGDSRPSPKISVVIPTKNNPRQLLSNLIRWNSQNIPAGDYEVIVIDDNSDIPVAKVIRDNRLKTNYNLRLGKSNGGAGVARNKGAEVAFGDTLLFVGDDCVPSSNLLREIKRSFKDNPRAVAVQGYTPFHPRVMSDFMTWLDNSGQQANWNALRDKQGNWKMNANQFCLTTAYAIDSNTFRSFEFDADFFKNAAWEDVSFGYRLNQIGLETVFNPAAVAFHEHSYTLATYYRRQFMVGRNLVYLLIRHPEMATMVVDGELEWANRENPLELYHLAKNAFSLSHSIAERPQLVDKYAGAYLRHGVVAGFLYELANAPRVKPLRFLIGAKSYKERLTALAAMYGLWTDNHGWMSHGTEWVLDITNNRPDAIKFTEEIGELWTQEHN